MRPTSFVLATALIAASASARDLPVPSDKGWKHAETGLILPATLDGLSRTKLVDATDDEHDVTAEFADAGRTIVATVYIFHPAIENVAMWFERSEAQIQTRDIYGGVSPMSAAPIAFTPPRGSAGSGMRRSYTPLKGPNHATALALAPLGDWLLAVRMSSTGLDPVALDRRMDAVIQAIRWPTISTADAAVLIRPCMDALHFEKAKVMKTDGSDLLLSLLLSNVANGPNIKKEDLKPITWCRDAGTSTAYGVYRDAGGAKGYELAIHDAGRVAHVRPTLDTMAGKGTSYAISLTGVDERTDAFPTVDRLPSPDQVISILGGSRSGSSTTKDGNMEIRLPPGSSK